MNIYFIGKFLTGLLVRIKYKVIYEGVENIPKNKGFILASNHRTYYDPMFISQKIKQNIYYMAKIELFKNKIAGLILKGLGAFPVDRGSGDEKPMEKAKELLNKGGVLGIFPEGTRSKDGKPQRARNGIGVVAMQTGADILPCAVIFGDELKFRSKVVIKYGKLLSNELLELNTTSPKAIRNASRKVMAEIVNLISDEKEEI